MSISPASLVVLVALYPSPGNGEADPGYLSILGSLDQLHIAGFYFQVQIAHHIIGHGFPVGGKVLLAAADNPIRPYHYAAALGGDFFCFYRYRAFDGLAGSDGELVSCPQRSSGLVILLVKV